MTVFSATAPAAEAFTPATEPVKAVDDRTITAKWDVGPLDADGYQPQAHLTVTYWGSPSRLYTAILSVTRVRPEGEWVAELPNIGPTARQVHIHENHADRFNRTTHSQVFEEALRMLRHRFAEGDPAVTAYFDPTSVEYAS